MNSAIFFLGLFSLVSAAEYRAGTETKVELLKEKNIGTFLSENREYWMKNPVRAKQRECFAKLEEGKSIDFVIDLAPSPSKDDIDRSCAESPLNYFLEYTGRWRSPSKSYFDAVQMFIDAVTLDVKPELCHAIIFDKVTGKFYLRGRAIEETKFMEHGGEFVDLKRNLKTMWPVPTHSKPEDSPLVSIIKNNLGRMTKLALWSRDNGLPTVLGGSEASKPVYTVIITDGASDAKLNELTKDPHHTTVIDIGAQRFVSKLSWDEMKNLASVITLPTPLSLPAAIFSVRNMACWLINK